MNEPPDRWRLIGDVIGFQFKLLLDGGRDLLLSPLSIVAALIGLVFERDEPGRLFYRLLRLGRQSDHWINLFGAADDQAPEGNPSSDQILRQVERIAASSVEKGGPALHVKSLVDRVLDSTPQKTPRTSAEDGPGGGEQSKPDDPQGPGTGP